MSNNSELATILLCTCDSYADLWEPFFTLLHKEWPDLPFSVLLNTETKSFSFAGVNILNLPNRNAYHFKSYGERIIEHIKSIKTEYTILMLDDFFIRRKVNTNEIYSIIDLMRQDDKIAVIYLSPTIVGNTVPYITNSKYERLNKYSMYKLNMQAAIWKTTKLLEYWDSKDDPWKWEIFANYKTFNTDDVFLQINSFDISPIFYGFNPAGMGVFRGKWVKEDVVPLFEQNNITIDYSKRGFYIKETEKKYFKNKFKLIHYMINRIGYRYTIGFFMFYIKKYICNFLHIKIKYSSHPDVLQAKYVKRKVSK